LGNNTIGQLIHYQKDKLQEYAMAEEYKIKSALFRSFCALSICLILIIFKFILKETIFLEEVYNYLASDIVFPG